jgi:hypothetical protein
MAKANSQKLGAGDDRPDPSAKSATSPPDDGTVRVGTSPGTPPPGNRRPNPRKKPKNR